MKVVIKCGNNKEVFNDKPAIVIGGSHNADFLIPQLGAEDFVKLLFVPKYNNYVLVNLKNSPEIFCNSKTFSKILVTSSFTVTKPSASVSVEFLVAESELPPQKTDTAQDDSSAESNSSAEHDIEKERIAIIKEIGYKVINLKSYIKSASISGMFLTAAMIVLAFVTSFGITNYLLGFGVDTSESVLNLTTNFWFLGCAAIVVFAVCVILRQSISSLLEFNAKPNKRYGEAPVIQKFIITITSLFLFVVYVMNLLYYKDIQGSFASVFISLMFVGALATVTVGSGYFRYQLKTYQKELTECEFREDFEAVLKEYRFNIKKEINMMSDNKLANIESNLVNHRLKMVVESTIGVCTAPFLAYGVSNTLASCFPEAANWIRISGLRFSPIFLVLATFLIIFAFISFVRSFTLEKQIKGSEVIKFDGYSDYSAHGVSILGLDSMRNLEKERKTLLFVACFIILIEFTMNV